MGTPASGGALPRGEGGVGRARLRQRAVGVDGHERVERALRALDAREHRARQLDAGDCLGAKRGGDLRQRAGDDVAHSGSELATMLRWPRNSADAPFGPCSAHSTTLGTR